MTTNPFEQLKPSQSAPTGGTLVFDFETVPDESRFPRPVAVVHEFATDVDLSDLVKGAVPEITKRIADGLAPSQLEELATLEQSAKKPRKGVMDAIHSALNANDSELESWKKACSVNPFKARICAFGWAVGCGEPQSMTARTDDEERAILVKFWELVHSCGKRCGYNIFGFDDMLAIVRSALLGVEPSCRLDRRRYGNREAIDLMLVLFPSGSAMPCKDVCNALGITPPAREMDGSKVFDLYEAEDMESIANYVESDVAIERELLNRFVDYLQM